MDMNTANVCSGSQGAMDPGCPVSNVYILQMKPNNLDGSLEAEAIPFQIVNGQDENQQYLISILESKQLQLLIDPGHGISATNDISRVPISQEQSPISPKQQKYLVTNNDEMIDSTLWESASCSTPDQNLNNRNIKKEILDTPAKSKCCVKSYVHISDRTIPPRAVAVLPAALQIRREVISPRRPLPARVRFGPLEGINRSISTSEVQELVSQSPFDKPIFLIKTENESIISIDVSDKDKTNWLSLLPLGDQKTANLWLYQEDNKLYALTTQTILARTSLVLGYSKQYAEDHGLSLSQPILDLSAELASKPRQWWCYECQRSMPTAALLQRHMDAYHLEEKQRPRPRYRCRQCTRTFCRLFTLKRHTTRYCKKKDEIVKTVAQLKRDMVVGPAKLDLPEIVLNTSTTEDSRLPSDESLQTLTNNLDFSTNLFDTDRMPNLDISGNSRSDTDLLSYPLDFKDDIALTGEVNFENGPEKSINKNEPKSISGDTLFLTCRHCNQTVIRGRQKQHVRVCTGRFECECGKSFSYKDKLAMHIYMDHGTKNEPSTNTETKEPDKLQYKCETCNITFKRRGMLVNHMWRVHKTASPAVPLERRVRHYPCVACPKVYRAAAKRDRHVRNHHPGSELIRGQAIEGGRRACEPAVCTECPRQYATRAKLLQHVRASHPHMAPAIKKKNCVNRQENKTYN